MARLNIGCVYYMVEDMERAVKFYTEVLGLPLVVRYGDDWAEVDGGSTRIGLHPTDEPITPGGATVSFYVVDLSAEMERLRRAGAKVGEIHSTPRGKMSSVTDTEGNLLHFSEFAKEWVEEEKYPLPKVQ